MKLERFLSILDGYNNPEEVYHIYITERKYEKGQDVKWSEELQKLADRDEVSTTKVKFSYSVTEAYGSSDRFECECGFDEILEGAVFCSRCGQRLNWEVE